MNLLFEQPHPSLRDYVNAYVFYKQRKSTFNNALPLGTQFLWAFTKGGLTIKSPMAGVLEVKEVTMLGYFTHTFKAGHTSPTEVAAINFKPLGVHSIFGFDMSKHRNSFLELNNEEHATAWLLDALRRTIVINEKKKVMDHWLMSNLGKKVQDMGKMHQIVAFIESKQGSLMVEEILERFSITERTLQRWFSKMVGVNPKLFLRIRKFNYVLSQLETPGGTLQQLLDHAGYFDQSHFIKDFMEFTNSKPSVFKSLMENDISRQTLTGLLKALE